MVTSNAHPSESLKSEVFESNLIEERLEKFTQLYSEQKRRLECKQKEQIKIKLLQFDKEIEGISYDTTPLSLVKSLYKKKYEEIIIAEVSAETSRKDEFTSIEENNLNSDDSLILWDLCRPFEYSCTVSFLDFKSPKGKKVFWHSSAHILGAALELKLGAFLTIGPPLSQGFYYDSFMNITINQDLYASIEEEACAIIKKNYPFEKLTLTKKEALELFATNPFKVDLIARKISDGSFTTCYRCGPLVDLCCGPHVISTGVIKAFTIEKHSSAYWLGNADNDNLQRVYGISFPDQKLLKEHEKFVAEAKERDHRKIGTNLNLFFFDSQMSPGSCFWLADGTIIYNKLIKFLKKEYRRRQFQEVLSPNIFSCDLFKTSGHYQNYRENMYCFNIESNEWALKPMNCPGHCLIFKYMNLSYRQLPLRLADFGVLHRNELTGSLTGLTRVRRFQQDDAHIFCTMQQLESEINKALDFLFEVYELFNFSYHLSLSTRPQKALGSVELWNEAESILTKALDNSGKSWELNAGDGAFYGPKIDVQIQDALKRWHQCGTIQLDFQLPLRFDLQYKDAFDESSTMPNIAKSTKNLNEINTCLSVLKDIDNLQPEYNTIPKLKTGFSRPVMIHRAIFGSIERFTAILLEHTKGKLPFWLSPRQIMICPVANTFVPYAQKIKQLFFDQGYDVFLDDSNATLNKKIREGQINQWNYIFVVGQQEVLNKTITIRDRDNKNDIKTLSVEKSLGFLKNLKHPFKKQPIIFDEFF